MANSNPPSDPVRRFRQAHPVGAIDVSLVAAGERVAVRAALYRSGADRQPAASALVELHDGESLGDAEALAVRRALAALGYVEAPAPFVVEPPNDARPVAPARATSADPYDPAPRVMPRRAPVSDDARRERIADLDALIATSASCGVRPARVAAWRAALDAAPSHVLDRAERRLRRWLARREPD